MYQIPEIFNQEESQSLIQNNTQFRFQQILNH